MSLPEQSEVINELAKERNRAAADRTLGAWIINSIHLIGFGITIDQIHLRVLEAFPNTNPLVVEQLTQKISMAFMGVSLVTLAIAMIQHYSTVQSLERDDYIAIPSTGLNLTATAIVLLFGIISLLIIFLGL